jgi:glycosyltransferase involved in cell wall biosynthesis
MPRDMRRLATLAVPGTYADGLSMRVGRTVANSNFLRALALHGSFEELQLVIGEGGDVPALEALTGGWNVPDGRLAVYHLYQLPGLLSRGEVDVLHHPSHAERLFDLLALRERYAVRGVPVTGQTHSLSYPRAHQDFARGLFVRPRAGDAIFCSSNAGAFAMKQAWAMLGEAAEGAGLKGELPGFELPVVPLGVDAQALSGGKRDAARAALALPADAVVLLCLARFTEYDKVDLFPLLQVLQSLVQQPPAGRKVYLVLAGARQGTKTPEMLQLWARALKVEDRLRLKVDFADDEKRDLLAAADLFVSPVDNLQETFGQSVVEALAAGLPCVVSDFDGYQDTIDETVGRRVPTRFGVDLSGLSELGALLYERPLHLLLGQSVEVDLRALEAALRELVPDRERRANMARAAVQRVKNQYDWRAVIPQYEAHWRRLLARAAAPGHTKNPLRLDFDRVFGHFATGKVERARRLVASQASKTLCSRENPYVLYPELKYLFVHDDAFAVLELAAEPATFGELVDALVPTLGDRDPWVAGLVVTWLLKHGLLVDA